MEVPPDDPTESHDQSRDAEEDVSMVPVLSPSTEFENQTSEMAYNDHIDQDEIQSGESGADNCQSESKAYEKSPCRMQQGAIFSGKILSFCCSECKGDTTYSPNDLLKHFQGAHKGTLPTYPCDLCTFVTNEFSSLQRHRIGHRDTLVTCEICNDGVQYSLLLLTRHFIMCHSCNGLFRCKKCDFSTRDAGTFVQHIHHHNESSHKCVRWQPMSPTHGKARSGTFPFTCQFCGYGAARKEYLSKHLTVAHGDEMDKTNRWKTTEDSAGVNPSGLKLLLKKSPAGGCRETQWMSKMNSVPGVGLLDHNGRLFNPEKTLEETQQFLERAVGVKKESGKGSKGSVKSEPQCSYPVTPTSPQPKIQDNEHSPGPGIVNPSNSNGLTVLMVKNKISIPPNCTTKVMGFKMVDGKKHLVLKVIPTKQELSPKNEMSPADVPEADKKTTSPPSSSYSLRSKSLVSSISEKQKAYTASISVEAQDREKESGQFSPLFNEHEGNLDRASIKAENQIGDEAFKTSSQLLAMPSDSNCTGLASTPTKEASFSINEDSCSNGNSSQPDHELSSLDPSAERFQSSNLMAGSPLTDGTTAETTPADILMVKNAEHSAADSGISEMSQSESTAEESTSIKAMSNVKSDLILVSAGYASPNCTADDTTPSAASSKTPDQMGNLVDNKSCGDESTDQSSQCESISEQASPKSSMKITPSSISTDVEINQPLLADDDASLTDSSKSTASSNRNTSQTDDIILPIDCSSRKEQLGSNNTFGGNESTPNKMTLLNTSPQNKKSARESPEAKGNNRVADTLLQNSPSQEVFSFHNYSKDSFGSSPDSLEADEHCPEDLEEDECEDDFGELKLASDWSLTLPASPPIGTEQSEEENIRAGGEGNANEDLASASEKKDLERVSDSDIEVDECIATVDDDLPISALPDTETGATSLSLSGKNDDSISLVTEAGTANLSNAAVLGKILEKHSAAIISQQLEKERMVTSVSTQDAVRPTKTYRILQTPEGKQMLLQTTETPYAMPVQLNSSPGFKLITKSCASKVNVSYVKPGIERMNKGTALSLTLNGGRIGMSAQGSSGEAEGHTPLLQAVSSSGGRYFVNASALKGPLLLSNAVKPSSGEQTTNTQPTCYLVQRPLPVVPVSNESTCSTSKTVLTTRPLLAMPVNSADKTAPLQTGRQAYLVRYISPAKPGILLNSSDGKGTSQGNNANEGVKSRVFLKIVRSPNGTKLLSTSPYNSAKKPIYVAASSLQSPYLLMSSNNAFSSLSTGLKTSSTPKLISAKFKNILPHPSTDIKNKPEGSLGIQKSQRIPMHTRPRSQRKRRALFEEQIEISPKTRRISSRSSEVASVWEPAAKDVERTLRLSPFSPLQQIKCPRRNQPVVVLNHPDADIPEVASIMKSVNRYKSEVVKVALSQSTVKALAEWRLLSPEGTLSNPGSRVPPFGTSVKERFILKLKLKKKSRSKYEVVRLSSTSGSEQIAKFSCWFCGRVFNNQEDWIGHGQRHLMEATRDWNKLF
ncbi:zinc finger protein 518A [Hoplias malabaricus]|uniref:zinc finger protein 518A n=1 Tax=Hoplias malabaricus TaxID=27720 RepID=UPI0034631216